MSELSRRGARLLEHPALSAPPVAVVADRARRYRARRRLRALVATCAAAAVVATGVAWRAAESAGPAPAPVSRDAESAGPAPAAVSRAAGPVRMLPAPEVAGVPAWSPPASGPAGTWRLASYLSEPSSWSRNDNSGPAAGGYLSCPQVGTCYYAGGPGGGSTSGPGPNRDTLYVSHDGGLSWTALRLSGEVNFTTALACPAAGDCLAGAEVAGQPALLATGDGGDSWSYRSLPPGDGVIQELTCLAADSCDALAWRPGPILGLPTGTWFLTTSDAGARWSRLSFPAGATIAALSCFTAADCVAVGVTGGRADPARRQLGVALWTADAGRTWTAGRLPAGTSFSPGISPSVVCAGTATCYALGDRSQRYHPQGPVRLPGGGTMRGGVTICVSRRARPAMGGCKPPAYILVGAAAVSTDGGTSWRLLAMPPNTPQPVLFGLSCPTAQDCWIAGTQAVGQVIPGGGYNGGSAMILGTGDGGATWTKATFAATRLASGQQGDSLMAVGEISCPAVNSCVGIGVADAGSYHTPVYTNAGG
jgi:hypothetical protein